MYVMAWPETHGSGEPAVAGFPCAASGCASRGVACTVQSMTQMSRSAVTFLAFGYLCCWQVGCGKAALALRPDGGHDTRQPDPGPDGPATVLPDGPVGAIPDGSPDRPVDAIPVGGPDGPVDAIPDGGPDSPVHVAPDGGADTPPAATVVLYAMSATFAPTDAGSPYAPALAVAHDFSVLIDWGGNTATTGANGLVKQVALAQTSDGNWTTQEPLKFPLGLSPYPDLIYSMLAFQRSQDGCTATASGTYEQLQGDVIYTKGFTATMTGVVDRTGPQFSIVPAGDLHPLSFAGVAVDEVLPTDTTGALEATGTLLALTGLPANSAIGFSAFLLPGASLAQPSKALAFATKYTLRVLPQPVDLVGNLATGLPSFSTLADPGLFAQDGFEGPVKAYMAGSLAIADSATLPIPAGKKALAIPPSGYSDPCPTRFTARMAVAAGATTVKFSTLSYSALTGYPGMTSLSYIFTVAIPNGNLLSTYDTNLRTGPLPSPWTGDLPGSTSNAYGDLQEASLALPSGANGEILFDIMRICAQPAGPAPGLIIDNLRVE